MKWLPGEADIGWEHAWMSQNISFATLLARSLSQNCRSATASRATLASAGFAERLFDRESGSVFEGGKRSRPSAWTSLARSRSCSAASSSAVSGAGSTIPGDGIEPEVVRHKFRARDMYGRGRGETSLTASQGVC